jgi:metallo-beta-lactamase class B
MPSYRFTLLALASAALALLAACATPPPPATEATAAAHVAAATQAAGPDFKSLVGLCAPPPAVQPTHDQIEGFLTKAMALPAPPAAQAFDNLYYVGAGWVSAWAIKTSAGIILIDALDNGKEAAEDIEPGLRKFGMDPAQIKYIIVTHGHGDHYGGVDYLVGKYHPRVVMSAIDWSLTETKLDFDMAGWDKPPKRDIAAKDGDVVTLGDTTVTLYITAGHTPGAISPVFDVRSGGQAHRVMLWGGTAFNFGKKFDRLDAYIASAQRMRAVAQQQGIDVLVSNHPNFDESFAKFAAMRGAPAAQNPFVLGTPAVVRALTVMGECAAATRDRYAMTP